jgi:putative transposase
MHHDGASIHDIERIDEYPPTFVESPTHRHDRLGLTPTDPTPPTMPQSLARNLIHLIYSTKNRQPLLADELRPNLFAYKAGILKEWDSPAITIGGVADHVHMLFILSKNHALAKIVEEVKKGSSKWMKTQGVKDFYWQAGYGAFSVSESNTPQVSRYIERQEAHHRKISFKDEFRAFLKRHGVEFDERYVWD